MFTQSPCGKAVAPLALLSLVVLTACAGGAGSVGGASSAQGMLPQSILRAPGNAGIPAQVRGTKPYVPRHLYVSDFGSASVLEFPIVKGKPAAAPSNSITGLNGPISIAFDGAGNLYESDLGGGVINVFAKGATGNATPLRTLNVGGAYAIAVDPSGYLYADVGFSDVYVFAPGASGNDAPLFDINNLDNLATSLTIAPNGSLYIASWAISGALVYTTPETNPTLYGEFVDASLGGPIGMAFDGNEFYVVDSGNGVVKAYSQAIGTVSPDRIISAKGVPMNTPSDVSAYKGNMYVTVGQSSNTVSAIFQFNPLHGAQKAKDILYASYTSGFSNAQDAQFGP